MPIISIIVTTFATSIQGAFKKRLNLKCKGCEFSVSSMITFFALVFFLIFSKGITFSVEFLPYSVIYSACYACASVTYVLALSCGSLALTQLIISYSCIIPLIYSLLCGEKLGIFQIVGIAFLFLSLIVTYYRKNKPEEKNSFSFKWLLFAVPMFFSNGFCGVIMRMQQLKFERAYDNSFMIFSLILATIILLIAAVLRERGDLLKAIKVGAPLTAACGASNGIANYFGIICLALIPNAVYYPIKSAGELILTSMISIIIFKEKLRPAQYVGVALGVLALVFINL